jgi:hypothetical protein
MSYEMKDQIAGMVAVALKPFYRRQEVDKDQYTAINKNLSRMLYEKIWDAGGMVDHAAKERWQKVAAEEVNVAIKDLATEKSETRNLPIFGPENVKVTTASPQATTEVAMRPAAVKV